MRTVAGGHRAARGCTADGTVVPRRVARLPASETTGDAVSPSSPQQGRHGCPSHAATGRRGARNSGRVALLPPPRATRLPKPRRHGSASGAQLRPCRPSPPTKGDTAVQAARPTGDATANRVPRRPTERDDTAVSAPADNAGGRIGGRAAPRGQGGTAVCRPPASNDRAPVRAVPPHGDKAARRSRADRPQRTAQPVRGRAAARGEGGTAVCRRTHRQRPGGRLGPRRPTGVRRRGCLGPGRPKGRHGSPCGGRARRPTWWAARQTGRRAVRGPCRPDGGWATRPVLSTCRLDEPAWQDREPGKVGGPPGGRAWNPGVSTVDHDNTVHSGHSGLAPRCPPRRHGSDRGRVQSTLYHVADRTNARHHGRSSGSRCRATSVTQHCVGGGPPTPCVRPPAPAWPAPSGPARSSPPASGWSADQAGSRSPRPC